MNCTALSDGYCLKAKLSDIGPAQLRDLDEYLSPLSPDQMGLRHPLPTNRGSTLPCSTDRSTGEHALDDR
jgi:hypothetical protein